ncbi:MAG: hypothetical protein IPL61_06910 [Myxococcales bacterium]|nr:hypothetical protein [Myxococcales bacterium]
MLRAPEASAERPYLHVGHGVSCARKTWGLVAILREPLRAPIKGLGAPVALDTIEAKVGERVVVLLHDADSLQWVVAATYPSPGPRADQARPPASSGRRSTRRSTRRCSGCTSGSRSPR